MSGELRFNGLGAMLEWKYGPIANTNEIDGKMVITAWRHPSIPQPDEDQLVIDFQEYQAMLDASAYQRLRVKEYPPVGDQLDEIWKHLQALGVSGEVLDKVTAVKTKYPKAK